MVDAFQHHSQIQSIQRQSKVPYSSPQISLSAKNKNADYSCLSQTQAVASENMETKFHLTLILFLLSFHQDWTFHIYFFISDLKEFDSLSSDISFIVSALLARPSALER